MFSINGPSGPSDRRQSAPNLFVKNWEKKQSFHSIPHDENHQFKLNTFFNPTTKATRRNGANNENKKKKQPSSEVKTISNIFKGCTVYINGRTGRVSSYNLAKVFEKHGGKISSMFTKSKVTHIVALNLNGSKAERVIQSAGKIKCVHPDWILQSISGLKKLPEFNFLVYK